MPFGYCALRMLTGVRPVIETMPLTKAGEVFQRMKFGDVKFRMVLTMNV